MGKDKFFDATTRASFDTRTTSRQTPRQRIDGELYERPHPNPFSREWDEGYDAAKAGLSPKLTMNPDYMDGYKAGLEEREEDDLDKMGSSNA